MIHSDSREQEFDEYIREGITAAKNGERNLARSLLNRAIMIKTTDARPWLWLSATTDDPQEQRTYLERAVAADPGNQSAVRGLMMLTGRWQPTPQGGGQPPAASAGPVEAQAQNFLCPKCGGHMRYNIQKEDLTCEYCGFIQVTEKRLVADAAETGISTILPTQRAHRWAESQHRLSCERCGAITLLPPGQTADRCPYCGSNRMLEGGEIAELVDPNSIALMKIDEQEAYARFRKWLGKGILAPDDLSDRAGRLRLVPAYYPFWTFDGTLEIPWRCEVNEGSSDHPRWVARNGREFEFFDDVLVPGIKAQSWNEIASVEPFNLKDLVAFKPEYVAGWTALTYDRSLSDGSLVGRDRVMRKIKTTLAMRVAGGQSVRNLNFGAGGWSGMTFKHVLLPLWIGVYQYRGKDFRVLVNGQTGKLGGVKPRDTVKIALIAVIGVIFVLMVVALITWLLASFSGAA